ncbi:MAG TPA: ABC transporter ATP-binding protein [Armatimonadota bacterium]
MTSNAPSPATPARGLGHHTLRRTIPLFRPYRRRLVLAALYVAFVGFCVSTPPIFTKYLVDTAIPRKDLHSAVLVMLGFVVLMTLRMVSWYAGQSILLLVREKIIYQLRRSVFVKLQELCMRFHQKHSPGFLYDRTLGGASTSVGVFLSMVFNTLVVYVFTMISALIICLRLNVWLTLWVLTMSLGYVLIGRLFKRRIHDITKKFNYEVNKFAGQVTDLLRGVKTIKAFAMEQRIISDFDENLWPLQLRSLDVNKETMFLGFFVEGLGYLINAAVLIGGSYLVVGSSISLGALVAFAGYQTMMIGMFGALATLSGTYGAAVAGLEQMYEILDERPSVVDKPGALMPAKVTGEMRFDDVFFSYDGKPVIQGLSVTIPHGQSVALVGPSGGGKSTLTNLLLRFYEPNKGVIRLDGTDIRQLPLFDYRSLYGVVLQDPFLFNDTIYNNLLAVAPESTDAQIRHALERAQAWEFVADLTGGWHFSVGESGSQLSGGQRQRIALARCFLTNPQIMILDEATSALDNQSEHFVQQALQSMMDGRTVFVIAHRLSTVRHVDRILVLQDGQVVQDGNYEELCQAPGLFRELHQVSLEPELPGSASDSSPVG